MRAVTHVVKMLIPDFTVRRLGRSDERQGWQEGTTLAPEGLDTEFGL